MRYLRIKNPYRWILIAGGICCLLFWGDFAFAFRVNTGSVKVQLSAGQTYNGAIEVENPSEQELFMKVYLADFAYIPPFDGEKEFFPPDSTRFSLSKWIRFSPQELTIPPYSKRNVGFTITPDEEFKHVRCGVIFFETSLGVTYKEGEAINILGRIGSLIFVEAPNKKKKLDFKNIKGRNYNLEGILKNTGNSFLHSKGTFYVLDDEGMVKDRGELKEAYLLPDDEAELDIELSRDLLSDEYLMVVTFDLEDDDISVKEIDFSLSFQGNIEVREVRD